MKFVLLTILVGLLSTGCSSSASTLDTKELEKISTNSTVENTSTENTIQEVEEIEEENVKIHNEKEQETQKEISKDEAVALVKKIVGSQQWNFAENIIANGKEGYLIQHTDTDADYRFFVDKKTGDVYCEKSTLVGEYKLVKNINDINEYLLSEVESAEEKISESASSTVDNTKAPNNTNKPTISAKRAKEIIETEYFGMDVAEPTRTTFNGKDTWEVKYKSVVQGELYTRTLYVDCQTGEVYAPY